MAWYCFAIIDFKATIASETSKHKMKIMPLIINLLELISLIATFHLFVDFIFFIFRFAHRIFYGNAITRGGCSIYQIVKIVQ